MATLYENYITGNDTSQVIRDTGWYAQTFTPSVNHIITSVKLKLYISDVPGILTVGIRATSSDLPTGSDLATGTTNANTLTTDSGGEWREITFTTGRLLLASIKYAIVCRGAPGVVHPNRIFWLSDGSSPTYTSGALCVSGDSGVSWSETSGNDEMFEVWGDPQGAGAGGAIFPADAITRVTNLIHRYNRKTQDYSLEIAQGEVTSDFGLPQWLSKPQLAIAETPQESEERVVKKTTEKVTEVTPSPLETFRTVDEAVTRKFREEQEEERIAAAPKIEAIQSAPEIFRQKESEATEITSRIVALTRIVDDPRTNLMTKQRLQKEVAELRIKLRQVY